MLPVEVKTVVCPYDTSHNMSRQRLQIHLVKCRKNYPTADYAICPMDATHHVPKPEFALHVEMCPVQYVVDSALVKQNGESNIVQPLSTSVVQSLLPQAEESWDDMDDPTYVPDLSKKYVTQSLKNAFRAQKKEFSEIERLRLQDLERKWSNLAQSKESPSKKY